MCSSDLAPQETAEGAALLRGRLDMLARVRGKVFKTLVKKRSLQQHSWASSSHSVAVFLGRQGAFRGSS